MKIEHVALWTPDLERLKAFYEAYFGAAAGPLYESSRRPFLSYFLNFAAGARVEIMQIPQLAGQSPVAAVGYAHLAISTGSKAEVDRLTVILERDGYKVTPPRTTGDGYYESTVEDPDGNLIEITV